MESKCSRKNLILMTKEGDLYKPEEVQEATPETIAEFLRLVQKLTRNSEVDDFVGEKEARFGDGTRRRVRVEFSAELPLDWQRSGREWKETDKIASVEIREVNKKGLNPDTGLLEDGARILEHTYKLMRNGSIRSNQYYKEFKKGTSLLDSLKEGTHRSIKAHKDQTEAKELGFDLVTDAELKMLNQELEYLMGE
jgi:hypothetical protein